MKTKTFLLLCLFSGIGLTQLSAQVWPEGTKSVSFLDIYYLPEMPVSCEGKVVDYIEGTIEAHWIGHFNIGKLTPEYGSFQWQSSQARGEITGKSGEVFQVKSVGRLNIIKSGLTTEFNILLKGDRGSHIKLIGTMTCDGVYTFEKAICN